MFNRVDPKASRPSTTDKPGFIKDQKGFAAVEFGMIALPFLLLIVAILEYSYGNFAQSRLDAVVAQASREIMTGAVHDKKVGGNPLTAEQFRDQVVCPKLPALLKCSDIYIDVAAFDADLTPSAYDSYVNATKSGIVPPKLDNSNGYCIGTATKNYVVLRVAYPAPVLTTSVIYPNTVTYKGRKARLLTSVATFRIEPFKNSIGC